MGQREIKHSGEENGESRVGISQRKSTEPIDHWGFLEEIEAPTWVDLALEAKCSYQHNNDEWFYTSHPFHQCSSRQLISAFSRSGEVGTTNMDLSGPSSPKLPPSVSRSRGKNYRSREFSERNCPVTSKKTHPVENLGGKSSRVNLGSVGERKPKSSFGISKASSVDKSGLTQKSGADYFKSAYSFGDSRTSSSSMATKEGESKAISTITSENSEQVPKKSMEVSSQTFGLTSGLLSTLKITLRKSCGTRQASRVEIIHGRGSESGKSSSSKSSVGSSMNPGYDVKNETIQETLNKDKTPESRNVMRMSRAMKDTVKVSNVLKGSSAQVQNLTSKSRVGSKTITEKSMNRQTEKSKIVCAKSTVLHGVNKQGIMTATTKVKDKVVISRSHKFAGGGKENAVGRMSGTKKLSTSEDTTEGIFRAQKAKKQSVPSKSDGKRLVGPKGKFSGQKEEKNAKIVMQKVYLR